MMYLYMSVESNLYPSQEFLFLSTLFRMEKDNFRGMVDDGKFPNSCQSANLDVDDKSFLEQINRFKITALFYFKEEGQL